MRPPTFLAACGLLIFAGTGPAAAAPELMSGEYQIRVDGSDYGVWAFAPNCDVPAEGCTAQVTARPKGWSAVATLAAGQWNLSRTSEKMFGCSGGGTSPGELRAKWDASTLTGSLLLVPEGKRCGGSAAALRGALELVKA